MPAGATRGRVRPARVRTGAAGDEFATRLRALGVTPQRVDAWLMVGKPTHVAAWKLHVSATLTGVDLLFERVLPCLARHGAHFKIAAERDAIVQLNAGNFGEAQIGKVITVYPRNDTEAVALARVLRPICISVRRFTRATAPCAPGSCTTGSVIQPSSSPIAAATGCRICGRYPSAVRKASLFPSRQQPPRRHPRDLTRGGCSADGISSPMCCAPGFPAVCCARSIFVT